MRRFPFQHLMATVLCCLAIVSCSKQEETIIIPDDTPNIPDDTPKLPEACIVDSIIKPLFPDLVTYIIHYPSVDPNNNPCTLSGTISFNRKTFEKGETFKGTLLYNHFTVYEANQVPSKGDLTQQLTAAALKEVVVSADYYGFGITQDKPQAYCISRANARASVDCFIAAQKLLKEKGLKIDDTMITAGYSEGGQTTIGVLREITESHPEIKVEKAFAGAGPYDLNTIYDLVGKNKETAMPSTVVNVLYAYNYFYNLGYAESDYLKEPTASHFSEWFLSKKYKRAEIDKLIGTTKYEEFATPAILDRTSKISQDFKQAFADDDLTSGWTPRKDFDVQIYHSTIDDTVPVENAYAMSKFLKANGVEVEELINDYSTGRPEELGESTHEKAALEFIASIAAWILLH